MLVFGNGGMICKVICDNVVLVDMVVDDYLQEVGVQFGMFGLEMYGGGDVMLFFFGLGSILLKGMLDNMKVFGVVKMVMGF